MTNVISVRNLDISRIIVQNKGLVRKEKWA